jgi:hypothetical protein
MLPNRDAFRAFVRSQIPAKSGVIGVIGVMPNKNKDLVDHTKSVTGVIGVISFASCRLEPSDMDERRAMAEIEGGGSPLYSLQFVQLQAACPVGLDPSAWAQAINDAGLFLDAHGQQAEGLGWSAADLFLPDGLILSLRGAQVRKLTAQQAQLSDDRVHKRENN